MAAAGGWGEPGGKYKFMMPNYSVIILDFINSKLLFTSLNTK